MPTLPGNARLFATLLVQSKLLLHCKAEKPFAHEWKHRVEALIDGQMDLGEFGYLYFIDFDTTRARTRTVQVTVIGE